MKKTTKKTPFVFYAGMVLLCLVLFSAHLTSGLYARYTSTATSSDSARVARFDVASAKKTDVDFKIDLDFFDPQKQSDYIEFDVSSSSEVAVRYDVVLVLPEGMVELIEDGILVISLDGDAVPTAIDKENQTVTFSAGTFNAAVDQARTHKLTFFFEEDAVLNNTIEIEGSATLRVRVEQVD